MIQFANPNSQIHCYGVSVYQMPQYAQQAPAQLMSEFVNRFQQWMQNLPPAYGPNFLQQGFSQAPLTMPGYIPAPHSASMYPQNPGLLPISGTGTQKSGLVQTQKSPPEFVTPGGYKVQLEGKDQAWKIITPEGKETRIHGDPHVNESDGGNWDFKKNMSFVLGDGTKISVNTVPADNGTTVTGSIDIMNGNQRATVSGIDKNELADHGIRNDRWRHDARTPDGDYAVMGGDGDDWFLHGKNEIVGHENNGETLKLATGGPRGISYQAHQAMQEPRFGSQTFFARMLQQMITPMLPW